MSSITITLKDLEIWAHIGTESAERAKEQRLFASAQIHRATPEDDALEHTIDYVLIAQRIRETARIEHNTLEALTRTTAERLMNIDGVEAVSIELKKFVLPGTTYVSVSLTLPS